MSYKYYKKKLTKYRIRWGGGGRYVLEWRVCKFIWFSTGIYGYGKDYEGFKLFIEKWPNISDKWRETKRENKKWIEDKKEREKTIYF